MMACDICGKVTPELTELRDIYKTKDVAAVCAACLDKINKRKNFLMFKLTTRLLKKYIRRLKK